MTVDSKSNPLGPGYEGVPGNKMRYRDAFNSTLRYEMQRDTDVFLMGEDISGGFSIISHSIIALSTNELSTNELYIISLFKLWFSLN